jgi:hypothetical protein
VNEQLRANKVRTIERLPLPIHAIEHLRGANRRARPDGDHWHLIPSDQFKLGSNNGKCIGALAIQEGLPRMLQELGELPRG